MDQSSLDAEIYESLPLDLKKAVDYWEQARGEKWAPSWQEFRLDHLPAKVIPWCVVLDIAKKMEESRYRFWGTYRTRVVGRDWTGMAIREVTPPEIIPLLIDNYSEVCKAKRTLRHIGIASMPDGEEVEFQAIRFPFSDNGKDVDKVLSISNEEFYSKEAFRFFGQEIPIDYGKP